MSPLKKVSTKWRGWCFRRALVKLADTSSDATTRTDLLERIRTQLTNSTTADRLRSIEVVSDLLRTESHLPFQLKEAAIRFLIEYVEDSSETVCSAAKNSLLDIPVVRERLTVDIFDCTNVEIARLILQADSEDTTAISALVRVQACDTGKAGSRAIRVISDCSDESVDCLANLLDRQEISVEDLSRIRRNTSDSLVDCLASARRYRVLRELGEPSASRLLDRLEDDAQDEVALKALNALGTIALRVLVLRQKVRRRTLLEAIESLGALAGPAVPSLIETAETARSADARRHAGRLLVSLGYISVPNLHWKLQHASYDDCDTVLGCLCGIGVEAVHALIAVLSRRDHRVAGRVADSIYQFGKAAIPALCTHLALEPV